MASDPRVCWWRRADSNRRPPACKAGALPTELRPRVYLRKRPAALTHNAGQNISASMQDVSTDFTLTLGQAAEGWILHLEARNLSPRTVEAYRNAARGLERFLRRTGMPQDVELISAEHIEAYLASEVATKAAATAHQRYRSLRQLFGWLAEQGDVRPNPMQSIKARSFLSTTSIPCRSRTSAGCSRPARRAPGRRPGRGAAPDALGYRGRLSEVTGLRLLPEHPDEHRL
jgi:Phage integrase, N-terminal SAM-like domain